MKKYCIDTSGISNPHEVMPEDIHKTMWNHIIAFIRAGHVAVTAEIYGEMIHIEGQLGECIKECKKEMLLEVGSGDWDDAAYIHHSAGMLKRHEDFIREYTGAGPRTVCVADVSIVALGKALNLPVVSMEKRVDSSEKRKIPNVCDLEGVLHLDFNDLLRREKISL